MSTAKGNECFPHYYDLLAQLLLESVQREAGADRLADRLRAMGTNVSKRLRAQHPGLGSRGEKIPALSAIMGQLGYSARSGGAKPEVIGKLRVPYSRDDEPGDMPV